MDIFQRIQATFGDHFMVHIQPRLYRGGVGNPNAQELLEMEELEASLTGFIGSCDATCSTGVTRNCAIVEEWSAPVKSCCASASEPPQTAQFMAIARKRT